mmetsp:Transcript_38438/g.74544  ORF Transcript_38438/g.74544 Transcript_38438/m.74544 type:complete len:466 (+) Transcript_38438:120-1517(+)
MSSTSALCATTSTDAHPLEQWKGVQRRRLVNDDRTRSGVVNGRRIEPAYPELMRWELRKYHRTRCLALEELRRKQVARPKHELVIDRRSDLIFGKVVEKRADDRSPGLCILLVETLDVRAQLRADPHDHTNGLVRLLAEVPDLIRGACASALVGARIDRPPVPGPVQAEERAERTELKPTHNELAKVRGRDVRPPVATDVRGPVSDARHGYVEPGAELLLQRVERALDVSTPHGMAEPLRPCPRTPPQHDHWGLVALHCQLLADRFPQHVRVGGTHEGGRPRAVAVHEVVHVVAAARLVAIQPPVVDAVRSDIPVGHLLCHEAPRSRLVDVVDVRAVVPRLDRGPRSVHRQEALADCLGIVLGGGLERVEVRAQQQLHADRLELVNHRLRIGPALLRENLVAKRASSPVEVVDHDERERDAARHVLPGHVQQLRLVAVAVLALPETGCPGWILGRQARRVCVAGQ